MLGDRRRTHEVARRRNSSRNVVDGGGFQKRHRSVDVALEVAREKGLNQRQSVIDHGMCFLKAGSACPAILGLRDTRRTVNR